MSNEISRELNMINRQGLMAFGLRKKKILKKFDEICFF